jgi:hypothetical protein
MSKIKVLVVIDHDIMIRHFLHSGVLQALAKTHDVTFVFPDPATSRRVTLDVKQLNLPGEILHLPIDAQRSAIWNKLNAVSRFRWRPGAHHAAMRKIVLDGIGPKLARQYAWLGLPGIFTLFRHRARSRLKQPNRPMAALLEQVKPDVVIHPTVLYGPYVQDLLLECKRRGIPLVYVMNSWDNIVTKSLMDLKLDWLLVWGEQTRQHALRYMKANPKKVVSFGAAQFDVYRDPPAVQREDFFAEHGIDPSLRLVLYAGSNIIADEHKHLVMLEEAICDGRLANCAILYRPHPWGITADMAKRILAHPWRTVFLDNSLRPHMERVAGNPDVAAYPDYRTTRDVLNSVDAVISPLSTIILEAMICGKPPICFHPVNDDAPYYDQLAPLAHFKEIYDLPQVLKAYGDNELIPRAADLLASLERPGIAEEQRKASTFFVDLHDAPYGERLVQFVEGLAGNAS